MRRAAAALAFAVLMAAPAGAVIILDSTWKAEGGTKQDPDRGFRAHNRLAHEKQFDAAVTFSSDGDTWGECSGTWIGNDATAGYIISAAHCFAPADAASMYIYRSEGGTTLIGVELFIHPGWTGSADDRTGYDLAIVKLSAPVTDAGPQPLIYAGTKEKGRLLTFVGFGGRGIGSTGESDDFDPHDWMDAEAIKAAGQGIIDQVMVAVDPVPGVNEDAGSYLGITLPKEDGSLPNPYGGATKPATRLAGLLGTGDSGAGAWFQLDDGRWVLAGVASDGTPKARYGDSAWFPRLSSQRDWIASIFPGAQFVTD